MNERTLFIAEVRPDFRIAEIFVENFAFQETSDFEVNFFEGAINGAKLPQLSRKWEISCLVKFYLDSGIYKRVQTCWNGNAALLLPTDSEKFNFLILSSNSGLTSQDIAYSWKVEEKAAHLFRILF